MTSITSVVTTIGAFVTGILGWMTDVFKWCTGEDVLPWFALGIGISIVGAGIAYVKNVMWGR